MLVYSLLCFCELKQHAAHLLGRICPLVKRSMILSVVMALQEEMHVEDPNACDALMETMRAKKESSMLTPEEVNKSAEILTSKERALKELAESQKLKGAAAESAYFRRMKELSENRSVVTVAVKKATNQERLQQAAKMVLLRWTKMSTALPFSRWAQNVAENKKLRECAKRVIMRWLNLSLQEAFTGWVDKVSEFKHLALVMRTVLSRWSNRSLSTSFSGWADKVDEIRQLKLVAVQVVERWNHVNLYAPFATWVEVVEVEANKKRKLLLAVEAEQKRQQERTNKEADTYKITYSLHQREEVSTPFTGQLKTLVSSHSTEQHKLLADSWVDGQGDIQLDEVQSAVVRCTLQACTQRLNHLQTHMSTLMCGSCARLGERIEDCELCERLFDSYFGKDFSESGKGKSAKKKSRANNNGSKKIERKKRKEPSKISKAGNTDQALHDVVTSGLEKRQGTHTLWLDLEREEVEKEYERAKRNQMNATLEKEWLLLEHQKQERLEHERQNAHWERKRIDFKASKMKSEAEYSRRRDEFLKNRNREQSFDYQSSGCAGGLMTSGLHSQSSVSRVGPCQGSSRFNRTYTGPTSPGVNRRLLHAWTRSGDGDPRSQSYYYALDQEDSDDGREDVMAKIASSNDRVFAKSLLQSEGLLSHSSSCREQQANGVMTPMQRIYTNLEQANCILERFCNKHLMGPSLYEEGERRMKSMDLQMNYATSTRQPVSLNSYSNPEPASNIEEVFRRVWRSELCDYIQKCVDRHPGSCVGWFLQMDSDRDGLVSEQELVEDLQGQPCNLTLQEAMDFVSFVPRFETMQPHYLIRLSSIWILLNCFDFEDFNPLLTSEGGHQNFELCPDDGSLSEMRRRHYYDISHFYWCRYEDTKPNMTMQEFHKEVYDISQSVASKLAVILRNQDFLTKSIEHEARRLVASDDTNLFEPCDLNAFSLSRR